MTRKDLIFLILVISWISSGIYLEFNYKFSFLLTDAVFIIIILILIILKQRNQKFNNWIHSPLKNQ